ncbi:SusC/RagA family TonB-linked outer membrane protein, partial [Parafilimonas sp.]|uniref:SusC/RagA family TonB-linked outer membrane protein n=1 Tax=Parafilimonas sp. TaxID=1969739 RepID=UPI0039E60D3F
ITILKDASAAIYGVRGGNGVVVVTTKRGSAGKNNINVDAYSGYQSFFRFPKVLSSTPEYLYYRADAEMNWYGSTSITQDVLDAAKAGTDPQYRSFDWRKFVMNNNGAALNSVNVNISGGSDKVNYYVSGTNLYQNSVLGKEYNFNRTNLQSNITAKVANGLKVGFDINGRVETRKNPGVPYGDDYWLARFAVLRNTPMERPYANDNPAYLNDLGAHLETNYAFLNNTLSGKYRDDWRVLQTNFHIEWDLPWIKGLSLRGLGSYYYADDLLNNQEYTYEAYTYIPATDSTEEEYKVTGGSTNPWRERNQEKHINTDIQLQASYNNTFGDHTISATLVAERIKNHHLKDWVHAVPQSNNLPLIYYNITDTYDDLDETEAKTGYIARITYNYKNRYFIEGSGRRDASYLFAPGQRVGYFPAVSAAWRITEEPFFKSLLNNKTNILSDFKIRGSYGQLGDDRSISNQDDPIVSPFAYLPGYVYGENGYAILDGSIITASRDKGIPITSISWMIDKTTDIGADFTLFNGKVTGSFDWFKRKRTGIPVSQSDVVLPLELGYTLPSANLESDEQYGSEGSLKYNGQIGQVFFTVGGNLSYARAKYLSQYKPTYQNSWDQYRNSSVNRFTDKDWGYICIGQFQSFDQINSYDVDIDGQGNKTLLPGDLIYKDINGDKKIDGLDQRPIGFAYGAQPMVNFGFTLSLAYKGFDFHADFSGASGYTWYQDWEQRWAFQNNGNLNAIFKDRWHRKDIYDLNSEWIPGKYPANRYNPGTSHSNYSAMSTFWVHNITYFRARTIELGYSLPQSLLNKIKIQSARIYINGYDLFSIDNLAQYNLDPETIDNNGLQFPQNRVINFGVNLSF